VESDAEEHREEFSESDFLSPRSRQANSMHAPFFLLALREKVSSPQQIDADCINLSAPAMTVEGYREAIR
jgi:hypothetical protein